MTDDIANQYKHAEEWATREAMRQAKSPIDHEALREIHEERLKNDQLRGLVRDLTTALENRNRALEESVKLQSHYAGLLNQMDGGRRLQFANGQEWEARLRFLKGPLNEDPSGQRREPMNVDPRDDQKPF
jgi:hypothetical protein